MVSAADHRSRPRRCGGLLPSNDFPSSQEVPPRRAGILPFSSSHRAILLSLIIGLFSCYHSIGCSVGRRMAATMAPMGGVEKIFVVEAV